MEPVTATGTDHKPVRLWQTYGGIAWRCLCGELNQSKLPSNVVCKREGEPLIDRTNRDRVLRNVSANKMI